MNYYKVLKDGKSYRRDKLTWSLPKEDGTPGDWHSIEGEPVRDERGFRLTIEPYGAWFEDLWTSEVFLAEPGERILDNGNHIVTERARLLQKLETPKWLADTRRFLESFPNMSFFTNHGEPEEHWRVFETFEDCADSALAEVERIREEIKTGEYHHKHKPVYMLNGNNQQYVMEVSLRRAEDIVLHNAWSSGRGYPIYYAKEYVKKSLRDVGGIFWDASALATCYVLEDIISQEHIDHMESRWRVWEKGYGLYCDIEGVFYVYKKP